MSFVRKLFFSIISLLLVGATITSTSSAFASEKDYVIKTKKELLEKIEYFESDNTISDEERQFIFDNTKPNVLNSYLKEVAKEIEDAIKELSKQEIKITTNNPKDVIKKSIKTKNNATVEVTLTDEAVADPEPTDDFIIKPLALESFGDRSYRIDYAYYHFAYPATHMVLNMFYKISSSGLTLITTSKAGTSSVFPTTVVGSTKIIDSRAEKEGYDINAQGDYTMTVGGYNGIGFVTINVTIIGTVKLVYMNSSSANVDKYYSVYK